MKRIPVLVALVVLSLSLWSFSNSYGADQDLLNTEVAKTEYQKGFADGHCEGWKDEKGKYAHCPYPPYPDYPEYPKKSTSYRDGYNDGFKRGIRDARKN